MKPNIFEELWFDIIWWLIDKLKYMDKFVRWFNKNTAWYFTNSRKRND